MAQPTPPWLVSSPEQSDADNEVIAAAKRDLNDAIADASPTWTASYVQKLAWLNRAENNKHVDLLLHRRVCKEFISNFASSPIQFQLVAGKSVLDQLAEVKQLGTCVIFQNITPGSIPDDIDADILANGTLSNAEKIVADAQLPTGDNEIKQHKNSSSCPPPKPDDMETSTSNDAGLPTEKPVDGLQPDKVEISISNYGNNASHKSNAMDGLQSEKMKLSASMDEALKPETLNRENGKTISPGEMKEGAIPKEAGNSQGEPENAPVSTMDVVDLPQQNAISPTDDAQPKKQLTAAEIVETAVELPADAVEKAEEANGKAEDLCITAMEMERDATECGATKNNNTDELNIADTPVPDTSHFTAPAASSELFIISKRLVGADARIDELIPDMLRSLGLPEDLPVRCVPPPPSSNVPNPNYNSVIPETVGESVGFFAKSESSPLLLTSVAFELTSSTHHTLRPFERSLQTLSNKKRHARPAFHLVKKFSSYIPLGTDTSADTHDVLWFSHRLEFKRAQMHLREARGETSKVQRALRAYGTKDSFDTFLSIVQAELKYVKSITGLSRWKRRFAVLLALTLEIHRNRAFVSMCGNTLEALECIKQIAELWSTSILKHNLFSDIELGINEPGSVGTAALKSGAISRNALLTLLKRMQADLENISVECDGDTVNCVFSCIPKKSRSSRDPNSIVTAPPRGRPPTDSAGTPMVWSGIEAIWRSSHFPDQTRVPKVKTPRNSTSGNATPTALAAIASAAVQNRIASKSQTAEKNKTIRQRPGGRTPNCSHGSPMIWCADEGCWKSVHDENETRTARGPKNSADAAQVPMEIVNSAEVTAMNEISAATVEGSKTLVSMSQSVGNSGTNGPKAEVLPANAGSSNGNGKTEAVQTPRKRASPDGVSPATGPSYTPAPRGRAPLDSTGSIMSWDNTAAVWRSNRIPSETKFSKKYNNRSPHPRPGGRTPHDSRGAAMRWCGETGFWRSVDDPDEVKASNSKTPRLSSGSRSATRASSSGGNTLATSSNAVASTPATRDSTGPPMQNPAEIPPQNGNGNIADDDTPTGPKTQSESAGLTMRPGGRTPLDSKGDPFFWDGRDAIWRSINDPNETKASGVRKWAVNGNSEAALKEDDDQQDEDDDDPRDEDFLSSGGVRLNEDGATETTDGDDVGANSGSLVPKPGGRKPHDSSKVPMEWDAVGGLWRSTTNPEETRTVKPKEKKIRRLLNMLDPPSGSTGGQESDGTDESEDEGNDESVSYESEGTGGSGGEGNGTIGNNGEVMRPVGRAPNDSNGERMEWCAERKCWRSKTNHAETKSRTPKPPRRMGKTLMQLSGLQSGGAAASSGNITTTPRTPTPKNENRRPSGRAPNDSSGERMEWTAEGLWKSVNHPEEVKAPLKR